MQLQGDIYASNNKVAMEILPIKKYNESLK